MVDDSETIVPGVRDALLLIRYKVKDGSRQLDLFRKFIIHGYMRFNFSDNF